MNGAGDGSGDGPLKTAGALIGLLTGIVAAIYVAGGLVLALRLFFDHFQQDEVVSARRLWRPAPSGLGLPSSRW